MQFICQSDVFKGCGHYYNHSSVQGAVSFRIIIGLVHFNIEIMRCTVSLKSFPPPEKHYNSHHKHTLALASWVYSISQKWVHPSLFSNHFSISFQGTNLYFFSRLLSVSALAWPFVVINRKVCSSASRRQCKEIIFERSSLSAEVKSSS